MLNELCQYTERMREKDPNAFVEDGFEKIIIPYIIIIDNEGRFIDLWKTGRREFDVPRSQSRSGTNSYRISYLLWDHIGYVLGIPKDGSVTSHHETWLENLRNLPDNLKNDKGVAAVIKFYEGKEDQKAIESLKENGGIRSRPNISFMIEEDKSIPVPCRSAVKEYVRKKIASEGDGFCSATGRKGTIARLHHKVQIRKGVNSFISFQMKSGYDSYKKTQGYNASIVESTERDYVSALQYLLSSRQRVNIGDATILFWAAAETSFEEDLGKMLNGELTEEELAEIKSIELNADNPNHHTDRVGDVHYAPFHGILDKYDEDKTEFYILSLAQGGGYRICVRSWSKLPLSDIVANIRQYFNDMAIASSSAAQYALPIRAVLASSASEAKYDNQKKQVEYHHRYFDVAPDLCGNLLRAVFENRLFPQTLLQRVIRRIKAEQAKKDKNTGKSLFNVTRDRAAVIRGVINRNTRFKQKKTPEELKMALDLENKNIGYRLGRLFATLEKIQTEANPGINATIRDRYYGAASGTPVTVFPNLMRLKIHHLSKLENDGRRVNLERLLTEIMGEVNDFPKYLSMENQGRFAIGYYHQMQVFYKKKSNNTAMGVTAETESAAK